MARIKNPKHAVDNLQLMLEINNSICDIVDVLNVQRQFLGSIDTTLRLLEERGISVRTK